MEEEKEYVGMQVCFICRKEVTAVLMDRRLQKTLTKHELGLEVCDKCKKKYLTEGVLLMEAEKKWVNKTSGRVVGIGEYNSIEKPMPTGNFVVIKDSAFKRIFNTEVPENKIALCDKEVLAKFQNENKETKTN